LKKWLFTSPGRPAMPEKSVPGEEMSTDTPSGRISRVQIT